MTFMHIIYIFNHENIRNRANPRSPELFSGPISYLLNEIIRKKATSIRDGLSNLEESGTTLIFNSILLNGSQPISSTPIYQLYYLEDEKGILVDETTPPGYTSSKD